MRKVLIVGAGQSGLQLGLSLLSRDYEVTVMSARTPEEIRGGRVTSTQIMFNSALDHERDQGLNLWEDDAPKLDALRFSAVGPDGGRMLDWTGRYQGQRRPIGELSSGAVVLGMADVVVTNDPVTGQGSNNASKCAASYLSSILERGEQPFDRQWMDDTFARFWQRRTHRSR